MSVGNALSNVHKPTLIAGVGMSTILIVLAVILLVVWINRRGDDK